MHPNRKGIGLEEVLDVALAAHAASEDSPDAMDGRTATVAPTAWTGEDHSRLLNKVREELAKREEDLPRKLDLASRPCPKESPSRRESSVVLSRDSIDLPPTEAVLFSQESLPQINIHVRTDVRELVALAYRSLMRTLPEDHVVLNPLANAEFIIRCRSLGATVDEAVLNRTLLNNRKASRHSGINRERVQPLAAGVFDEIGHAVEIAASIVQRESFDSGCGIPSVDDILCGPDLRRRFGDYVAAFQPGVDTVESHLVLLAYRKWGCEANDRLSRVEMPEPLFTASVRNLDLNDVPESCGVYRVLCKRNPIFVSGTANLRNRVRKHLDTARVGFLPDSVPFELDGPVSFEVFAGPQKWLPRRAEAVARSMRIDQYPELNWREKGGLFPECRRLVARAEVG
jgi:hypothetical protein